MPGIALFELLFLLKTDQGPLTKLDSNLGKFAMRLRLSGRDLMRLGKSVSGFFSSLQGGIMNVMGKAFDWEVLWEDIGWAVEDVVNIFGTILAPMLYWIGDLIEMVADFLERNPWLAWGIAFGIAGLLIITIIGKILGQIISAVGAFNLYVGALLHASTATLTLGQALEYIRIRLTEGSIAAEIYLRRVKGIYEGQKKGEKGIKRGTEAWVQQERAVKETGVTFKEQIKTLGKVGAAVIGLGGLAGFLIYNWEYIGVVFEWLQSLSETLFSPLEPVLDWLLGVADSFLGWWSSLPEPIQQAGGAIALFVVALAGIKAGWGIIGPILDLLTKGILGLASKIPLLGPLIAHVTGGATTFGGALKNLWHNFVTWATSIGSFVKAGILEYLQGGFKNVAIAALSFAGGLTLGFLAGIALKKALGGWGPVIVVLIGGIIALTAALAAFWGVATMGTMVPVILAGIGMAVGGVLAALTPLEALPMQRGGIITRGGLARLHPGEEVTAAATVKKREAVPPTYTLVFQGPVTSKEWATKELAPEIAKIFDREYKRGR